jgi:membrane fusion protein, multidrug efflux system
MFHCTTMTMIHIQRKSKPVIAIALLFAATALISSCGPSKEEKQTQQETLAQENAIDTPAVVPVTVTKGKLTSSITVPGELSPYNTVNLYAKIASYVKNLYVDIGSQVHTGELLATLEAPEINQQLDEAKSRIQQNKAIYFADKATYDRLYNTSKTPGTISENDLEQAKAKVLSDSANVEAAKSQLREIAANLNYLQIRAPFDGVITLRNINPGTYVGPGSGSNLPLFVLEDHKHLRLVISVPEAYTGGLSGKNSVKFTVRELPGETFDAQIKRLAGALDEHLRSERLEMDVYNYKGNLLPNMYADVTVPLPNRDSAFVLPKSAVVTSTEKVFVITIVDNHAKWVDVQKGLENKDMIEVYGQLKVGDQVVKSGTDEIRDGQPVRITQDKSAQTQGNNNASSDQSSPGSQKGAQSLVKDSTDNGRQMAKDDSANAPNQAKKKK